MKKIIRLSIVIVTILMSGIHSASANAGLVEVKTIKVDRTEKYLLVEMNLDASNIKMKSDREVKYTPMVISGDSVAVLPQVIFAGRNRYIQNQRHGIPEIKGTVLSRVGKEVKYSVTIPYRPWMEYSHLVLNEDECDCGITIPRNEDSYDNENLGVIDFRPHEFSPTFSFVTPPAEVEKVRTVNGSAFIDFPVNKVEIYPDYRRNPIELAKIRETIEAVANDSDIEIITVSIKGYASPEGNFANNERLAKGRASSLAEYVRGLYKFNTNLMHVTWIPEDWIGVRKYLTNCALADTAAIISIIDNERLSDDNREAEIKRLYPRQYNFLLENVFPGLRHTDYTIEYKVRSYTSIDEIITMMKTNPGKLSIDEIYFVANSLTPDSSEYRDAIELAVRLYPDNEAANLNMAAIALQRNEMEAAKGYLEKAGNSPNAIYARGVYEYMRGNIEEGKALISSSAKTGLKVASDALEQIALIESPRANMVLK